MTLQEIFDQLASGELTNLHLGGPDAYVGGIIGPSYYPRLVSHVNLALTALYSRFLLKENRLTIELIPGQYEYQLASKFALSQEPTQMSCGALELDGLPVPIDVDAPYYPQFIQDTVCYPFRNDVIKVEKVLTPDGDELPLNDATDDYSIMTPTLTKLRIPADIVDQGPYLPDWLSLTTLEVVYRAKHPKIVITDSNAFDPQNVEVELPETHLMPLLYFVASRINNPIGMTNEFHAGNSYAAKYEMACKELEMGGYQVDMGTGNTKLRDRGFA